MTSSLFTANDFIRHPKNLLETVIAGTPARIICEESGTDITVERTAVKYDIDLLADLTASLLTVIHDRSNGNSSPTGWGSLTWLRSVPEDALDRFVYEATEAAVFSFRERDVAPFLATVERWRTETQMSGG